ncbi:MAG TPA: hypothetical protein VF091_09585 [Gaiellaceae bacterium]
MDSSQAPENPQASGDAWLAALRGSAATEEFPKTRPAGSASKMSGIAGDRPAGNRPLAFVAAAGAAAVGGLLWAGVVIETRYDIGILAWLVGIAAGRTLALVANGRVGTLDRVAAGLLAAGGIIVGKYVIFVHDVKVELNRLLVGAGDRVGYLDSHAMSVFVHRFGDIVKPIYILWVGLAFITAARAAGRPAR